METVTHDRGTSGRTDRQDMPSRHLSMSVRSFRRLFPFCRPDNCPHLSALSGFVRESDPGLSQGAAEYAVAIDELRRLYLADRLPGETAAAWLRRTGRARGWFGEAEPLPTDPDSSGRAPAKGSRHGE